MTDVNLYCVLHTWVCRPSDSHQRQGQQSQFSKSLLTLTHTPTQPQISTYIVLCAHGYADHVTIIKGKVRVLTMHMLLTSYIYVVHMCQCLHQDQDAHYAYAPHLTHPLTHKLSVCLHCFVSKWVCRPGDRHPRQGRDAHHAYSLAPQLD